jgi:c-di-GMP-binding flagellar brake protein YcgR
MLPNRRTDTRVPIRAQVTCVVDTQAMRGVSRNLSQGGMQVEVGELKTKDAVQLTFRLPVSGVVVDAVGAVVWGSDRRRGIRFTSMGEQSQQTIRQFIAEQTERQSKM